MRIVGTRWDGAHPRLEGTEGDVLSSLRAEGRFDWQVGAARRCVGWSHGAWRPCPDDAEVGDAGQCMACFRGRGDPGRAHDDPGCVFEPRCADDPTRCACSFGTPEHVVYIAFHGILPKVGMTLARRVRTRLTEQGADAYFVLARAAGRAEARRIERLASFLHGVPEWRTHKETLPQLVRPLPWPQIEARAQDLRDALRDRFAPEEALERIVHPLPQPLPSPPRRVPTAGRHRGRWLGAKGAHLFYEEAPRPGHLKVGERGPVAALRLGDLLGREVRVL